MAIGNYFSRVGTAIAAAKLAAHTSIGCEISFSHRGGGAVTLIVKILTDQIELVEEGGVTTEQRTLTTEICTGQTGFAASSTDVEPITPGDSMSYQSRTWYALAPISNDRFGTKYFVRWSEKKRLTSGNR